MVGSTEMIDERREHQRVPCDVEATIAAEGVDAVHARCLDVSSGGICLRGGLQLPISTPVALEVRAAWAGGATDALALRGRVMWCSKVAGGAYQIGVMFTRPMAAETSAQLAVLIDLAAGRIEIPRVDEPEGP